MRSKNSFNYVLFLDSRGVAHRRRGPGASVQLSGTLLISAEDIVVDEAHELTDLEVSWKVK
jgi:hypothetical protein